MAAAERDMILTRLKSGRIYLIFATLSVITVYIVSSNLPSNKRFKLLKKLETVELTIVPSKWNLTTHSNFVSSQRRLDCMRTGTFKPRPGVTERDVEEMRAFMRTVWNDMGFSSTLERDDLNCGDNYLLGNTWRGLCNVQGDTPCCYEGRCISAPEKHCRCKDCYDVRQRIIANLSLWETTDKSCAVNYYRTSKQSCDILKSKNVRYFTVIGDSLMRHIYSALLIVLKGDEQTGSFKPDTPPDIKAKCSGIKQFTMRKCKFYLDEIPVVCDGQVQMEFVTAHRIEYTDKAIAFVSKAMQVNPGRGLIVMGNGLHEDCSWTRMRDHFLRPVLNVWGQRTESLWPHFLWISPHLPGLLKPPKETNQDKYTTKFYNKIIENYLRNNGVAVLNTEAITEHVLSWDGTHYGYAVNYLIAQIVMNYFDSLSEH